MTLPLVGAGSSTPTSGGTPPYTGPLPSDLANLVSWFDSTQGRFDATSGGNPVTTDLGQIAGWLPRAGSVAGRITQATSANKPQYDAQKDAVCLTVGPGGLNQFFSPNAFTIDRRAFSLFMICELTTLRRGVVGGGDLRLYHTILFGTGDDPDFFYRGTDTNLMGQLGIYESGEHYYANVPLAGSRSLIGWTLGAGGVATWANATKTTGSALSAGAGIVPVSLFSGDPNAFPLQATILDLMYYARPLSDSDVTDTLLPYAYHRGVNSAYSKCVICVGDSNTLGYGTVANRSYPQLLSVGNARLTISAEYAISLEMLYNDRVFDEARIVPNEHNVLILWVGTNDIANDGKTAAQVYSRTQDYVTSWRAAVTAASATGKVVIVTPLPRGAGAIAGQYALLRTAILANVGAPADAVADPIGNATLAAAWGDGTYDYDGVHPNYQGYFQFVAPIIQTALNSVL